MVWSACYDLRIVVISDIHSNLDALESVIGNLPNHDRLICLGDIVGYGPQPNEVLERLQGLNPAYVLMGNHDCAAVTGDTSGFSELAGQAVDWTRRHLKQQHLEYLSKLQPSRKIVVDGTIVGLFHGSPRDPLSEYIFPGMPDSQAKGLIQQAGTSLVLLGHTHMPMFYSFGREMVGNPGSVGQPRDGDPRASFAILTVSEGRTNFEIRRVEYPVDSIADKIRRAGLPTFLAERLYMGA